MMLGGQRSSRVVAVGGRGEWRRRCKCVDRGCVCRFLVFGFSYDRRCRDFNSRSDARPVSDTSHGFLNKHITTTLFQEIEGLFGANVVG